MRMRKMPFIMQLSWRANLSVKGGKGGKKGERRKKGKGKKQVTVLFEEGNSNSL